MKLTRKALEIIREDGSLLIEDRFIGTDIRFLDREIIFQYDGKFYRAIYYIHSITTPDPKEEIECIQVKKESRSMTVWEDFNIPEVRHSEKIKYIAPKAPDFAERMD